MMIYIFLAILFSGCNQPSPNQVCFPQKCFNVEVVVDEKDRERGLQDRRSLDANAGMLFIFPISHDYAFWMKDTLIPLDMIWLDYAQRVAHIEQNVPPCEQDPCPSYAPSQKALYVLELNAGQAERINLRTGQRAEFRLAH
ncbi:MAG: DUF192 domain-containing protein [Candidatus Omnitrophota bacterium]|nr:DUF192 domain-containing protein [Candidatus Omnitrophota bacterium]